MPPAPCHFPQYQSGGHGLRRARRDPKLFGDRPGRGNWSSKQRRAIYRPARRPFSGVGPLTPEYRDKRSQRLFTQYPGYSHLRLCVPSSAQGCLPFGRDLGQKPGADIAGKNPWPLFRPPARTTPETVATASLRSPRSRRASPPRNTKAGQTSLCVQTSRSTSPEPFRPRTALGVEDRRCWSGFRQRRHRRRFPPKPASVGYPAGQSRGEDRGRASKRGRSP